MSTLISFATAEQSEIDKFCSQYGSDVKAVDSVGKTLLYKAASAVRAGFTGHRSSRTDTVFESFRSWRPPGRQFRQNSHNNNKIKGFVQ